MYMDVFFIFKMRIEVDWNGWWFFYSFNFVNYKNGYEYFELIKRK